MKKNELSSSISKFVEDIAVGKMSSAATPISCSAPASKPTYLQALLGDNPPLLGPFQQVPDRKLSEDFPELTSSSRPADTELSTKFSGLMSSPFGEDREDSKDSLGFSFSSITPSFSQQRRNRSVSLSALGSQGSSLPFSSPLRTREHTSEAGSPTLEQVLLMRQRPDFRPDFIPDFRHDLRAELRPDLGYGSLREPGLTDDLYSCLLSPSLEEEDCAPHHFSVRPTLQDMFGIDQAVAQAVHNLQSLQQRRVELYSDLGFPTTSSPLPLASSSPPASEEVAPLQPRPVPVVAAPPEPSSDPLALERAARLYRSAASVCEANCTWSGQLPHRSSTAAPHSSYSTKIFLGGVPWDISEQTLIQSFSEFGEVRVEWPGRDYTSPPKGYLYLVFQDEEDVKDLLAKCSQDFNARDSYYYKIASRRSRSKDKEVQIIPWVLSDSNYVRCSSPRLDPQKTVFVGALHGMMTAQALAVVFNDLFQGVIYAGLDTDKYKYPIGSGRVTFNNKASYMKAVAAAFIEIKTPRFSKKVQVDPYLEDTLCCMCAMKQGPYFCREKTCFNYFCHGCWEVQHANARPHHKPLMRNIRGLTRARASQHHHDYNNNHGRYRTGYHDQARNLSEYFTQAFGSH